jgi:GNAT superfamily N-acetyltransferase
MQEKLRVNKTQDEKVPSFSEVKVGDTTRFICVLGTKEAGSITVKLIGQNIYEIAGLFVEPSQRGKGISSGLVKRVNTFLKENNSLGKLVNMIKGEAAQLYENNGWIKGDFKSHGAYGAYEYIYDGRKK